jgi:ABC-type phosphate/phosphonate transport system substrate-binding protein
MMTENAGMTRREFCGGVAAAAALGIGTGRLLAAAPGVVKIGLVNSLFREVPQWAVMIAMQPFKNFLDAKMAVNSKLLNGGSPRQMGKDLTTGELDLGVFHGVEFAWARQKYPKLKAMFIAVNRVPVLHAHLIVNKNAKLDNLAALRNKKLLMPMRSREHCWMFLEKRCTRPGTKPNRYFDFRTALSNDDALSAVAKRNAHAAVVDEVDWDDFKKNNPVQAANLRPLVSSEPFPCALVAYLPGHLNNKLAAKFKEGMLQAHKQPQGKDMLKVMRITGFEDVPDDFDKQLAAVAKAYPPDVK